MLRHQNIFKARKGVVLQIKYKLGKQLGPDGDGLPMLNNLWDCFHSTTNPLPPPLCLHIYLSLLHYFNQNNIPFDSTSIHFNTFCFLIETKCSDN